MLLHIEIITDTAALEQLAEGWYDLWQNAAEATIFQSPDWIVPWWRFLGEGQLWVITVRQASQLVGLIPLFCLPTSAGRQLLLVGCGNSDRLGMLAANGYGQAVAHALMAFLDESREQWDRCDLHPLAEDSPLLGAAAPREIGSDRVPHDACPLLQLPGDSAELPRAIPEQQWKKLQYYRRRAEREGRVEICEATTTNAAEKLEVLLRLHQQRWSRQGQPGVLAQPPLQRFHAEVVGRLARGGHLRLYNLSISGRPAAALYGMLHAGCFSYYIGGFDPGMKALSPGMLVVGHAIEQAVQQGAVAFDFLRGREAYKYAWGAVDRFVYVRRLWKTPRGGQHLHVPPDSHSVPVRQ
jgi:CelD/BcsL family acetyltransferase involved in cellulose biosynthesis